MKASRRPQIWFLTGSQGLYGPETLDQVAVQSQQIVAALNDSADLQAEVVWYPVVTDADAIRQTFLQANAAGDCIGVIAWMHTFSPAKMWIAGLEALKFRCCTCTPRPTPRSPGPTWTWTS